MRFAAVSVAISFKFDLNLKYFLFITMKESGFSLSKPFNSFSNEYGFHRTWQMTRWPPVVRAPEPMIVRKLPFLLPARIEKREVFGVGSIPITILPS